MSNPQEEMACSLLMSNYLLNSGSVVCPPDYLDAEELEVAFSKCRESASIVGEKAKDATVPEEIFKLIDLDNIDIYKTGKGTMSQLGGELYRFGYEVLDKPAAILVLVYQHGSPSWSNAYCLAGKEDSNFFICTGTGIMMVSPDDWDTISRRNSGSRYKTIYMRRLEMKKVTEKRKAENKEVKKEKEEEEEPPQKKAKKEEEKKTFKKPVKRVAKRNTTKTPTKKTT